MDYVAKHAEASTKLQDNGVAVQFRVEASGSYDPLTDSHVGSSTTTVSGYAAEIPADPEMYEAMELSITQAVTLMFVPTTFGQTPSLGSIIQWAGASRTVKHVIPIRPAGQTIAAKIVVI